MSIWGEGQCIFSKIIENHLRSDEWNLCNQWHDWHICSRQLALLPCTICSPIHPAILQSLPQVPQDMPRQPLPQLVHMMYVSTSLVISEYNITQFRIQEKQKECVVTSKMFGEPPPIPPPATPVSSWTKSSHQHETCIHNTKSRLRNLQKTLLILCFLHGCDV